MIGSRVSGVSSTPGQARGRERDEREVEPSLSHLRRHLAGAAGGVTDLHLDERVVCAELGEQTGEVDRAHALSLHRAEQNRPAHAAADSVHGVAGGRRCRERRPRLREQGVACVGQLNLVGGAIEQRWLRARARGCERPAETADWTTCSRSEARVKLPSSATARKVASCSQLQAREVIAKRDNRQLAFALNAIDLRQILDACKRQITKLDINDSGGAPKRSRFLDRGVSRSRPRWRSRPCRRRSGRCMPQRDHFSSLTVTLVFAAYAVAVARQPVRRRAPLRLLRTAPRPRAGAGAEPRRRRRVRRVARAARVAARAGAERPGHRCGDGNGYSVADRTARHARQCASGGSQVVAIVANLGGLGLGGLVSGILAEWAPSPLRLPFIVFLGALLLAEIGLFVAPETRGMQQAAGALSPPASVGAAGLARTASLAAAIGAAIAFALFGLVTSLAPSFLEGTLHAPSHALAGAVSFAMFAAAALTQMLTSSRSTTTAARDGDPGASVGRRLADARALAPGSELRGVPRSETCSPVRALG